MKSNFLIALTQLAAERNLDRDTILSAVEEALSSTFKKESLKSGQNISVKLDTESGEFNVWVVKTVVISVEDSVNEKTRLIILNSELTSNTEKITSLWQSLIEKDDKNDN